MCLKIKSNHKKGIVLYIVWCIFLNTNWFKLEKKHIAIGWQGVIMPLGVSMSSVWLKAGSIKPT